MRSPLPRAFPCAFRRRGVARLPQRGNLCTSPVRELLYCLLLLPESARSLFEQEGQKYDLVKLDETNINRHKSKCGQ